ncbi:MAG: 23S rRNA (adenine(2503)-C(2))-methyltransferase RlmN [Hespellia sp.]|nr:23S rRNA (adenine(2503)-C(2))-methyltransferase RlmN [Hespellia sp.]
MKKDIASFNWEQMQSEIELLGEKKFRAKQIYEWLHEKGTEQFSEMTNLSRQLQEKLNARYEIRSVDLLQRQVSALDGTNKFLFQLCDGNEVESVLMKYKHGNSVCISSQAGCRMGCRFCASTIDGLERNLTVSEMLGQIYQIQKICGERISHIVVMGTGEPLDNYENLTGFIRMISDEHGLHISQRNITVSTCGIVPGILRLSEEHFQITLALSLHGSTQEKRKKLMPIANKYPLEEVLSACDAYFQKTGRRMTYEYSLIHGVNDTDEDAGELIHLLGKRNCHVNLIPVNPIKERNFKRPSGENAQKFKNKLEKSGINVTIRREMGSDIDGACGQLRRRYAITREG